MLSRIQIERDSMLFFRISIELDFKNDFTMSQLKDEDNSSFCHLDVK